MYVLQTSPPFSSLSLEGVSGRDERGMLSKRGAQRGSDVVSLVTTTSLTTVAVVVVVVVSGSAAGRRAYVGEARPRCEKLSLENVGQDV